MTPIPQTKPVATHLAPDGVSWSTKLPISPWEAGSIVIARAMAAAPVVIGSLYGFDVISLKTSAIAGAVVMLLGGPAIELKRRNGGAQPSPIAGRIL